MAVFGWGKIKIRLVGFPSFATGRYFETKNRLDCLQLLHFHLGSQLGNIRDVATGVHESARFYVELHKLGVNIRCFDVGGGLGVDYEGNRTQSDCSVNYSLNEYAATVVWGISQACLEHGLPHPTIITESGRGITAHHAVLVANVIGVERYKPRRLDAPSPEAPRVLHSMWETWTDISASREKRSLRSWIHEGQFDLADVHNQYNVGLLSLAQRAWAEQLYLNICHEVGELFNEKHRSTEPLLTNCKNVLPISCMSISHSSNLCPMLGA